MQPIEYQILYETEQSHWWFKALRLFLQRFLPAMNGRSRLALDIGCGTGAWMFHLRTLGYRVVGVDFSPQALELARRNPGLMLVRASANWLPFRASFDLVSSIDVLEVASVDPVRLATAAVCALKPGGTGLFLTAAYQWLLSEHDRAVDSVHRYNLEELKALFSRLPVHVTIATHLYFFVFPFMALYKLFNRPKVGNAQSDVKMPAAWINSLLLLICRLEAAALPNMRFPAGSSVLVKVSKNA